MPVLKCDTGQSRGYRTPTFGRPQIPNSFVSTGGTIEKPQRGFQTVFVLHLIRKTSVQSTREWRKRPLCRSVITCVILIAGPRGVGEYLTRAVQE